MENETALLTALGLSPNETKVYSVLLSQGESKAAEIAKALSQTRGTIHFLLNTLVKKGLVNRKGKGKEATFSPESPYKLETLLKGKLQEISQVQKNLASTLPALMSKYNLAVSKPTVRYFEGKEGLKEVFKDIYAPTKPEVFGAADIERIEKVFPGFLSRSLIPKRLEGKLHSKAILPISNFTKELKEKDKEQDRETKLIDGKKYPLPAEIDVYENKVAMLSFAKGNFVGLIVENQDIANTLKSIFDLAFEKI